MTGNFSSFFTSLTPPYESKKLEINAMYLVWTDMQQKANQWVMLAHQKRS